LLEVPLDHDPPEVSTPSTAFFTIYFNNIAFRDGHYLGKREEAGYVFEDSARGGSAERFQEVFLHSRFFDCHTSVLYGKFESAFLIAQKMMADFVKVESNLAQGLALAAMAEVSLAQGETAKAVAFLRNCVHLVDGTKAGGWLRGHALGQLSAANLAAGGIDDARRYAEEAVEFCRPRDLKWTVQPWLALARVRIQSNDETGVLKVLEEARQIINDTGAVIFQPFLHECRAEFATAFECEWSAADELNEAQRLFVELGADGHVQRIAGLL